MALKYAAFYCFQDGTFIASIMEGFFKAHWRSCVRVRSKLSCCGSNLGLSVTNTNQHHPLLLVMG